MRRQAAENAVDSEARSYLVVSQGRWFTGCLNDAFRDGVARRAEAAAAAAGGASDAEEEGGDDAGSSCRWLA